MNNLNNNLIITYYYRLGVSGELLGKVLGTLEQVFFGKAGGREREATFSVFYCFSAICLRISEKSSNFAGGNYLIKN